MHAPWGLLIIAAIVGVVVPIAVSIMAPVLANPLGTFVADVGTLATVSLLVARVAYRQGYERGAADRPAQ